MYNYVCSVISRIRQWQLLYKKWNKSLKSSVYKMSQSTYKQNVTTMLNYIYIYTTAVRNTQWKYHETLFNISWTCDFFFFLNWMLNSSLRGVTHYFTKCTHASLQETFGNDSNSDICVNYDTNILAATLLQYIGLLMQKVVHLVPESTEQQHSYKDQQSTQWPNQQEWGKAMTIVTTR